METRALDLTKGETAKLVALQTVFADSGAIEAIKLEFSLGPKCCLRLELTPELESVVIDGDWWYHEICDADYKPMTVEAVEPGIVRLPAPKFKVRTDTDCFDRI